MATIYQLKMELESPALIGSGEGWGSVIDSDVVFDDLGLPFIPARRVKGLLRESAQELLEMFKSSGMVNFSGADLGRAFGVPGAKEGGIFVFDNLYLPDYEAVREWLRWAQSKQALSVETTITSLTELRDQTSLNDDGIAEDGLLRRSRVLQAGLIFMGDITIYQPDEAATQLLALACRNLKYAGSIRHKGCGRVKCSLTETGQDLAERALADLRKGVA